MRLYDTHCHFETVDPAEIAAILRRAKAVGVEKLMAVGGSELLNASAARAVEVAARDAQAFPEVVCALGFDRDQVGKVDPAAPCLPALVDADLLSPTCPLRAIGEIGLDYHYSPETREAQMEFFGSQLRFARERDLPVVIHTREADRDTEALLKEIPSRGIIHCYTGTPEFAKRFLDLGFFISFSGIATFRAAENVRESFRVVPRDRILIETDSPYLAPVPLRGQRNEPAFVRHTCEFLCSLCNLSADEFAELTFANAERILSR